MTGRPSLAVILAAGKGARMNSALEKVLHPLGGTPMLGHVLSMAQEAGFDQKTIVLGPGMDTVEALEAKGSPGGGPSAPLSIETAVITVR